MVVIAAAEPQHHDGILALASRTLGWSADERFAALYRWKHEENAFGPSPAWVALDGDRVVGFRVLLRWRWIRGDGRTASAVRAVDTATDPDYQGQGIFKRLTLGAVEDLTEAGVDFVFNTPNDQSRPGYLKMGWIELGRPAVSMAPRITSLARLARARASAELWSLPTNVGVGAGVLADEGLASRLLAARAPEAPTRWTTDRSPAWMRWRFGLEALHYRVLPAADLPRGGRHGDAGLVFRLRRRGSATEATVADLYAPDDAARRFLLRGLLRATRADYALVGGGRPIELTPSVALPTFGPLVTWRALAMTEPPELGDFAFTVGDLELF